MFFENNVNALRYLIVSAGKYPELWLKAFKDVLFIVGLTVIYCHSIVNGKRAEMSFVVSKIKRYARTRQLPTLTSNI
jgi:hypothetical protein